MSYKEAPGYIDNLLALRGLCSLGVVLTHCLNWPEVSLGWHLRYAWPGTEETRNLLQTFWPSTGKNFVLIFFVHSGYLMGKIFFMDRYPRTKDGLKRFYKSRFLRIAPLLYFNLIICLFLLPSATPTITEMLGDFAFINNFTGKNINTVTWSLSWEMQYYLVAPFVFFWFGKVAKKEILSVLGIAAAFLVLVYFNIDKYPPIEYSYFFLLGFLVNHFLRLWRINKFPFSDSVAIVVGFLGGNLLYYYLENSQHSELAGIAMGICAALTIFVIELPRKISDETARYESYGNSRLIFLRFWTWLGILSYGIYLWHLPIILAKADALRDFAAKFQDGPATISSLLLFHGIQIPFVIVATLILSLIGFLFIETRFRPHLYNWDNSRYCSKYLKIFAAVESRRPQ